MINLQYINSLLYTYQDVSGNYISLSARNILDFEEIYFSLKGEVSYIQLCSEILWDGHLLSDFYGFDIVQKLRLEYKVKCPIIICSFLSKQFFLNNSKYEKAKILNAPGHYFVHLPIRFDFNNYTLSILDEDLLNDINYSFFNIRGRVSEIIHQLQNSLYDGNIEQNQSNIEIKQNTIIRNAFANISKIIDPAYSVKLDTIKKMILEDLKDDLKIRWEEIKINKRYDNGANIVHSYREQVYSLLPEGIDQLNEQQPVEKKTKTIWEVLYIDDDQSNLDIVSAYFNDYKIFCHKANTAKEAFEILENDRKKKKIAVLITDFRLLIPGTDIWQEMQGYQILKRVHDTHPNPLVYFMLTSKKGTIIKNIRARKDFEILWFAKTDVLASKLHFNPLYQKVKELGDEIYFRSQGEPRLTVWTDGNLRIPIPLSRYYKAHCETSSEEYIKSEDKINQIAKSYLDNCLKEHSNQRREFQITLSDGPSNKKMLDKFRESILAGRRIAIGLFYMVQETPGYKNIRKGGQKEFDVVKQVIFNYMKPGSNYNKANSDLLFSSTLALSLDKDLPPIEKLSSGQILNIPILSEEMEFLSNYLKINIDHEAILSNQIDLEIIDIILGEIEFYFKARNILYDTNLPFSVECMGNNITTNEIRKLIKKIDQIIIRLPDPALIRKEIYADIEDDIKSLNNIATREIILTLFKE